MNHTKKKDLISKLSNGMYPILTYLFIFITICVISSTAIAYNVTYTYDDAGRLTMADYEDKLIMADYEDKLITYKYDNAGNLLERKVTVGWSVPDIKANGSDVSVTLGTSEMLSVSISMTAGSRLGEDCDWWVLALTPFGWFYYNLSSDWTPGLFFTHQGSLSDLGTFTVLNMVGVPAGTYTFYFAVDTNMNGSLDLDQLYYDSVVVNITP